MTNRWGLVGITLLLVAVTVVGGGVVLHQHHELSRVQQQLRAAGVRASDEHLATLRAQGQLSPLRQAATAARRELAQAEDRLQRPQRGLIRSRTLGTPNGDLPRFTPNNTVVTAVRLIRAVGDGSPQLAIIWHSRGSYRYRPALGFLLWTGRRSFARNPQHQFAYRRWHLGFDWHQGRGGRSHVGPPSHRKSTKDPQGEFLRASVGDATGDGVPDVLVSLDTGGSGGCTTWRVLQTTGGRTTSILRRFICDGGVSIHDGLMQITHAIHGKNCSIHGCGTFHRILLQREGSSWIVVSRTVVGHRVPTL